MKRILTHDGALLDDIVWQHYGRRDVLVAVLEANPGLSRRSAALPAGLVILLPDLPAPAETQVIRLWS